MREYIPRFDSSRSARSAAARRRALAAEGVCINGRHHGPAVRNKRCDWCLIVKAIGVVAALELAKRDPTAPRPPEKP